MANYGDVALNLGPDWDRNQLHDRKYALRIVGHKDGIADVYLTKDPDKRHQFAWTDKRYRDEVDLNLADGYRFVKKGEWTKHELMWEWNADDEIAYLGMSLMARPAELYFAAQAEKEQQRNREQKDKHAEEARQIAERSGISIFADDEAPRKRGRR